MINRMNGNDIDVAVEMLASELLAFLQLLVRSPSVSGAEQQAQAAMAAKYRSLRLPRSGHHLCEGARANKSVATAPYRGRAHLAVVFLVNAAYDVNA
jgi:hypothetical protein